MNNNKLSTILFLSFILVNLPVFAGNSGAINIAPAIDQNQDPNIFETTIVAAVHQMTLENGDVVDVFAYNGQIRVKQGDRVIVHLKNNLPEGFPTTIHWHGIELNNKSDGTPLTQTPVAPGGTFTYDFIVPRSGVFWYHPHARGAQEVSAGLYAPFIVIQPEEQALISDNILPKRDISLVLSDLSVVDGKIKDIENTPMLETMNGTEGDILLVNGKQLPTLRTISGQGIRLRLINASISRYFRLSLPGHKIFRVGGEGGLLSNVRLEGGPIEGMRMAMNDSYEGATGKILIDQGYKKGEILLAPAQRADVVIVPTGAVGNSIKLKWIDFARGRHQMMMTAEGMKMVEAEDDGLRPSINILKIKFKPVNRFRRYRTKNKDEFWHYRIKNDDEFWIHSISNNDEFWHYRIKNKDEFGLDSNNNRDEFRRYLIKNRSQLVDAPVALIADRTDTQIKLQSDMMAMMSGAPKYKWFKIDGFSGVAGRENYRTATVGETIEWETHNHTDMHHPFHLHGFSFQPTSFVTMNHDEGYMDMWKVNNHNEYVDTINVPPHTSAFYNFKIDARPGYGAKNATDTGNGAFGDWLFHCHIFQHGQNGMMSFLRIE